MLRDIYSRAASLQMFIPYFPEHRQKSRRFTCQLSEGLSPASTGSAGQRGVSGVDGVDLLLQIQPVVYLLFCVPYRLQYSETR